MAHDDGGGNVGTDDDLRLAIIEGDVETAAALTEVGLAAGRPAPSFLSLAVAAAQVLVHQCRRGW